MTSAHAEADNLITVLQGLALARRMLLRGGPILPAVHQRAHADWWRHAWGFLVRTHSVSALLLELPLGEPHIEWLAATSLLHRDFLEMGDIVLRLRYAADLVEATRVLSDEGATAWSLRPRPHRRWRVHSRSLQECERLLDQLDDMLSAAQNVGDSDERRRVQEHAEAAWWQLAGNYVERAYADAGDIFHVSWEGAYADWQAGVTAAQELGQWAHARLRLTQAEAVVHAARCLRKIKLGFPH